MVAKGGITLWIKWAMGFGLPGLGIGWEATYDVVSTRLPGSQETWKECSAALPKVREVVGSRLDVITT